jgi:ABC-2 type transport system ATP-binding protein
MEYVLETKALGKRYQNFTAMNGLNMHIPKGAIYGFVGRNGAGKTTLIRLICGLQEPTSGEYTLFGVKNTDVRLNHSRRRMGAVVETPSIYLDMTAEQNLRQQYKTLGLPSEKGIRELLHLVGLDNTGKKKAKNFSLGMRQRLGIEAKLQTVLLYAGLNLALTIAFSALFVLWVAALRQTITMVCCPYRSAFHKYKYQTL